MMKLNSFFRNAILFIALSSCADAAGRARHLRLAGDNHSIELVSDNNNDSIGNYIDEVTMNRIKQRYLRQASIERRELMQEHHKLGHPTRKDMGDPAATKIVEMSMSMSMSMPEFMPEPMSMSMPEYPVLDVMEGGNIRDVDLSMSLSMSMSMSMIM